MPTELQNVLDILIAKFRETFVFIDDFSIVTKGTRRNHRQRAVISENIGCRRITIKGGKVQFCAKAN